MTMHRGIVEVFGIPEGSPESMLTMKEQDSVKRFAKDKHLVLHSNGMESRASHTHAHP